MKRPLVTVAAGFVLGEVLCLRLRAAVKIQAEGRNSLLLIMAVFCAFSVSGYWYYMRHRKAKESRSLKYARLLLFFLLLGTGMIPGVLRTYTVGASLDEERQMAERLEGIPVRLLGTVAEYGEKDGSIRLTLKQVSVEKRKKERESAEEQVQTVHLKAVPVYIEGKAKKEGSYLPGSLAEVSGTIKVLKAPSNPGTFDFAGYYRSKGVVCQCYGKNIVLRGGSPNPYLCMVNRVKEHCSRILESICTTEDAAVYEAILLGDTSGLPEDTRKLYQKSGISHLLAVSGQHLSIIGGGVYLLLRRLGLGFQASLLAGGSLVITYGILTGSSGSAMRAVIMILCQWTAQAAGRTYDTLSAVSLAALLLLWQEPFLLTQSGFQLSFGAVIAIAGLGGYLAEMMKVTQKSQKGFLVSLSVQMVLTPLLLWHYYEYPLYGMGLNFLIVPFVPILMYSGLLVIAFGSLWRTPALLLAKPGHLILLYYEKLCEKSQTLPGANLILGRPFLWAMAFYGVWIFAGIWCMKRKILPFLQKKATEKEKTKIYFREVSSLCREWLTLAVCFFVFAAGFFFFLPRPVSGVEVTCLDVGQGDGLVLQTGRNVILIDGGSSSEKTLGERTLEPYLKCRGISLIDYAVVSHGDHDHISGLLTLLEKQEIKINLLLLPIGGRGQEVYEKLENMQKKAGGKVHYLKEGEMFQAGNLKLFCLYAEKCTEAEYTDTRDRNAHSLVLCADYGEFHMLFTGDMGMEQEKQLLAMAKENPRGIQNIHLNHVQVLKTAHHGSSGSSCKEFLEKMPLRAAVISYGVGNTYGHPAKEVVERMKAKKVSVLETGKGGAICIKTDGNRLKAGYLMPDSR